MIQSLDRGLRLLSALRGGALSASQAARLLGVDPSTASRLFATLEARGFVEQDPVMRHFRLGISALQVGWASAARFEWAASLKAAMRFISARCGETVLLSAFDGTRAVYLDRIDGMHRLRTTATVGAVAPWHAGASGKAILANLPPPERRSIIAGIDWVRYTPRTIMESEKLVQELNVVRRRGYAISREEIDQGILGIALPICGPDGRVLGALGTTAPLLRMNPGARRRIVLLIRTALAGSQYGSRTAEGRREGIERTRRAERRNAPLDERVLFQ